MKYRKEIDGLRSLAIIPVILFHAGIVGFSGGGAFAGGLMLQDPSRFAGAADQLTDAVLVNPYDVDALANYRSEAPGMPYSHPTVEHYTPLFVTLGVGPHVGVAGEKRTRPCVSRRSA